MQGKSLYGATLLALGTLLVVPPQTGQAQSFFEADASDSVSIVTAPSSTFSYSIAPGNVTVIPGALVLSGDGTADGAGAIDLLNYNPSLPSLTDTVQASSFVTGTTGTSPAKKGKSTITVASNPVTTITLKNTGKSNLTLQFDWSYDIFVQASSVRKYDEIAAAFSIASVAFKDPKNSISVTELVGVSNAGGVSNPVSLEQSNTLAFTVTVSPNTTDTLTMSISSTGAASSPEPGAVATFVGMGSGIAGLLAHRRRLR